jgi:surface antigen
LGVFGAGFSKEVLGLGLALGVALALVEPLSRMISGAPSWPMTGPATGTLPARRTAAPASYNLHLVPYGIDRGICERAALAADLKDGLLAAPASLVGGVIGAKMDSVDQGCVSNALEYAPDQRRILWRNSNNGLNYTLVATQTYQTDRGTYCREYGTTAVVAGQPQDEQGQACRQASGVWTTIRDGGGR